MESSITFHIEKPQKAIAESIQHKIDNKTKPLGALGVLETLAKQIALIQQTITPILTNPCILVFAGDHGIVAESVSPFPQEVTPQMVYNFLNGGAAINVFARQNKIRLKIVDSGVAVDLTPHPDLLDRKVAYGTKNFAKEAAMTRVECLQAMQHGALLVEECVNEGTNVIGFGEMGIGNTSSSAALMHLFTNLPITDCVGKGTGLDENGISHKAAVIIKAIENYPNHRDPLSILSWFGGFELVMTCGAILKAAEKKMVILIDGFNITAALLAAYAFEPNVLDYCIFSHCSNEKGHQSMISYLKGQPIISLDMRLGEGTGVAVAYPILESAVSFLNEMASFDSANVSREK
jgi:nicotinate-nucleotide--dimethylbenzimidazole phosphoribosyltransferase